MGDQWPPKSYVDSGGFSLLWATKVLNGIISMRDSLGVMHYKVPPPTPLPWGTVEDYLCFHTDQGEP